MEEKPVVQGTEAEQRIFEAAHEVFVQKGLDGAKMQEIADRAGINKALLHYYYRSKEKLYEMVARAVIHRAFPVIRNLFESDLPLEDKICHFVDRYIDIVRRNPFLPLFILSEMNKHPDRFFESLLPNELPKPEVFLRQVEEAIANGSIRPVKGEHLLVNMVSMCIFPFVAKPMLRVILGMNPEETNRFYDERKTEIIRFILLAIRP